MIPRPWAIAIDKRFFALAPEGALRRTLVAASLMGLCLWSASAGAEGPAERASSWQQLKLRDGITSYRRARPGHALDAFRARARFEADMWTVLAVLEDVDRASEWTAHCPEMRKLSGVSYRDMLVYAQTDAPWPVRDRDVVTRVTTTVRSASEVITEIHSVHHLPERDGLVRIPSLDARYTLRQLEGGQLEIEYMIEVDPGGTLPDWLKNMVARDLAHDTIQRLRERSEWAAARSAYAARSIRLRELGIEAKADGRPAPRTVTLTNANP